MKQFAYSSISIIHINMMAHRMFILPVRKCVNYITYRLNYLAIGFSLVRNPNAAINLL